MSLWVWGLLALPLPVERVALYAHPSYFAPVRTVLMKGTEIQILARRTGWVRIRVPTLPDSGWIPAQAVERPRWQLPGGKERARDREEAVALAGKGLEEMMLQAEKRSPESARDLNHLKQLARLAEMRVHTFLQQGQLQPDIRP